MKDLTSLMLGFGGMKLAQGKRGTIGENNVILKQSFSLAAILQFK
jgi:hypothetical protein